MLVKNIKRTITEPERDGAIAEFAARLASSGPFRDLKFIPADMERDAADVLVTAGIDTAHINRLIVLDPSQFSLRNGMEDNTIAALSVAMGLGTGTDQLPIQWASSVVFAVVNTQRRANARGFAVEYLARQRALAAPEVQSDDELKETGTKALKSAREQLEKALKRAYQHVVFLAQPDPDGARVLDQLTFDDDNATALDGTLVWKALAAHDKVFDSGQFTARALVHNLREQDYGRSLSEIRGSFYSAPRLPLLYGGDSDLQHAIFDAVSAGLMEIVDGNGNSVAVTAANQVNLSSTSLRLAKPAPKVCAICGQPEHDGPCIPKGDALDPLPNDRGTRIAVKAPGDGQKEAGDPVPAKEQQLAFSFTSNLLNKGDAADGFAALFRSLYVALDEQQVSYLQGTLTIVLDAQAADALREKAAELGLTVNRKDV